MHDAARADERPDRAARRHALSSPQPAPSPRRAANPRVCIALLIALGFALGFSEFVVIGIESQVTQALGVPLARAGELISCFALAYAVATPVLALTTGRFKRFPLVIVYASVLCLADVLALVAPTFEIMLVARVLIGLVSGALLAAGVTYIPELTSPSRTSPIISMIYAAFAIAMIVSTSVGKLIAEAWSWRATLATTLVLCVVICAALIAVLPRTGATDEPATAREQAKLLLDTRALSGMAIFVFGVGSVYVFYAYITPYLEEMLGMSALGASGVLMAYGVMCMISNLGSGLIDARFGIRALLVAFPVQALLLLALFLAGTATLPALVIIMGIGLSMYLVSVPCISLFMRIARDEYPAALTLAASLEPMAFNIGIAFGTAVSGAVVGGPGMAFVGAVGAVFSLVACALVALTVRLDRRRAPQTA